MVTEAVGGGGVAIETVVVRSGPWASGPLRVWTTTLELTLDDGTSDRRSHGHTVTHAHATTRHTYYVGIPT